MAEIQKPIVVCIEGLISAGKTTVINQCIVPELQKRGLKVKVIREPVDKWVKSGILELFYTDQKRWAYTFQTMAFFDRISEINKVWNEPDKPDFYIMERSPYSDHIFMNTLSDSKTVTELEHKMYTEWWSLWHTLMPFSIDTIVYLRPSLDVCMERLAKRNRTGEQGVSEDYQKQLLEHHDKVFNAPFIEMVPGKQTYCLTVNGDEEIEVITKKIISCLLWNNENEIIRNINNHQWFPSVTESDFFLKTFGGNAKVLEALVKRFTECLKDKPCRYKTNLFRTGFKVYQGKIEISYTECQSNLGFTMTSSYLPECSYFRGKLWIDMQYYNENPYTVKYYEFTDDDNYCNGG